MLTRFRALFRQTQKQLNANFKAFLLPSGHATTHSKSLAPQRIPVEYQRVQTATRLLDSLPDASAANARRQPLGPERSDVVHGEVEQLERAVGAQRSREQRGAVVADAVPG